LAVLGRLRFDDTRARGRRKNPRHFQSCSREQRFELPGGSLRAPGQRHHHHVCAAKARSTRPQRPEVPRRGTVTMVSLKRWA